jgi:hypothetical protein
MGDPRGFPKRGHLLGPQLGSTRGASIGRRKRVRPMWDPTCGPPRVRSKWGVSKGITQVGPPRKSTEWGYQGEPQGGSHKLVSQGGPLQGVIQMMVPKFGTIKMSPQRESPNWVLRWVPLRGAPRGVSQGVPQRGSDKCPIRRSKIGGPTRGFPQWGTHKGFPKRAILQHGSHKGWSHRRGPTTVATRGSSDGSITRRVRKGCSQGGVRQGGPIKLVPKVWSPKGGLSMGLLRGFPQGGLKRCPKFGPAMRFPQVVFPWGGRPRSFHQGGSTCGSPRGFP